MSMAGTQRLSTLLADIFNPERRRTSFGELVDELDQHGMAIILILFSVPSALPLPAPGYSTALSIPLMLIGLRLLSGRDTLWLPHRVRDKSFEPARFKKLLGPMLKLVRFIERFSRPRFVRFAESKWLTVGLGALICLLAASMALPIPGTNTLPAGGIFLIGFGLLEKDGLLILGGVLYGALAAAVSFLVILFGYELVKRVILEFFRLAA